ncbi:hypothetical protein CDEF62S_04785 [Castellaniella defragrans]
MQAGPVRFGFVLLPHFTLTAFSGMLDVLRLAGDEGDHSRPLRCSWQVIDETLSPVRSSSGIQVVPSEALGDPARFDYLVVVGGLLTRPPVSRRVLEFIRRAAGTDVHLVGLCTGVFTLMQAGVLDGYRMCVSWFHYWDFLERFPGADPGLVSADRLFVFDRRRITCSGGRASIDVAAEILRRHVDQSIVQKALRILQVDDTGRANAAQPLPPGIRPSTHPAVRRAVLLMEQHVGKALSLGELADRLGVSARHLERLFKECTGQSPRRMRGACGCDWRPGCSSTPRRPLSPLPRIAVSRMPRIWVGNSGRLFTCHPACGATAPNCRTPCCRLSTTYRITSAKFSPDAAIFSDAQRNSRAAQTF